MTTPEARYARLRTTAVTIWAVIGGLVLAGAVFWALGQISSAIAPFAVAFIMVFLLNWPVRALSDRGLSRGLATIVCFICFALVIGALMTLFAPPVGRQIVAFANAAPTALASLQETALRLQQRFSGIVFPAWASNLLRSTSQQVSQLALSIGNNLATIVVNAGAGVAHGLLDVVLALVVSYWALKDLPKIREELIVLAGPKYEDDAEQLIRTVTHVVGGYLKGQTLASLTTGALAVLGLWIFHVPYPLVLGLITFIFNYVPYVGPFIAGLIAGLVGLFVSPWTAVWAVLVIVVAQNFTDTVVSPRVMSDQVDLHPILVIFSLLVGGALFGIPGMLFAIPVAATGKGLFVYYYERRTQRQLASEDGALFRGSGSEPDGSDARPDPGPGGMPA